MVSPYNIVHNNMFRLDLHVGRLVQWSKHRSFLSTHNAKYSSRLFETHVFFSVNVIYLWYNLTWFGVTLIEREVKNHTDEVRSKLRGN